MWSSLRCAEAAAARCLNHEHVAYEHFDLAGRTEFLARSVGAQDPIPADGTRSPARHTERRHAPMIREHHRRHRCEETHATIGTVSAAVTPSAAAPAPDRKRFDPHRKA